MSTIKRTAEIENKYGTCRVVDGKRFEAIIHGNEPASKVWLKFTSENDLIALAGDIQEILAFIRKETAGNPCAPTLESNCEVTRSFAA